MFAPNAPLSVSDVASFEAEINFSLPKDYRTFLLASDGGSVQAILKVSRPGDILVDYLFGLRTPDSVNLLTWHRELEGEIPLQSLAIGSSAGGGLFLLCVDFPEPGLYFYDHNYSFPGSSDEENTFLLFDSFQEFLENLSRL